MIILNNNEIKRMHMNIHTIIRLMFILISISENIEKHFINCKEHKNCNYKHININQKFLKLVKLTLHNKV